MIRFLYLILTTLELVVTLKPNFQKRYKSNILSELKEQLNGKIAFFRPTAWYLLKEDIYENTQILQILSGKHS